jgi:hypothetical protein
MEVRVEILYDELGNDGSRRSDELLRDIQRRMGSDAVWEKYHDGWRVVN